MSDTVAENNTSPNVPRDSSRVRGLGPFAYPVFRWLFIASLVGEIGTWMQFIGAEWLMTEQTLDPLQVALLGAANSLPVLFLGIPSGVFADLFGRRRILLISQFWMLGVGFLTVFLLRLNTLGPWTLILLTFFLYCGMTMQEPAMHAVYPEVVPPQHLPAAVVLHDMEFNVARVIGPVLAGMVIRKLGTEAAFIANILSFLGLIWFLWVWRAGRKPEQSAETLGTAFKSAVSYVRSSRDLQVILVFVGLHAILAVAPGVLLPIVARTKLHLASDGYGLLYSCLGAGAILGAAIVAPALARLAANRVMSAGMVLSSISLFALSRASSQIEAGLFLISSGVGFAVANTTATTLTQSRLTDWARGRVLGIWLMVFYGGIAAGSAAFGWLARVTGIGLAQMITSGCFLLLAAFALGSRLRLVSDQEARQTPGPSPFAQSPSLAGSGHGDD